MLLLKNTSNSAPELALDDSLSKLLRTAWDNLCSPLVRRMFTADAVLIGVIGGFVGVIFGILLGRLVDWLGHLYLESKGVLGIGQMSIVPPWLAIGALVFASFIGVLDGLYPAACAARLDPVVALKHE